MGDGATLYLVREDGRWFIDPTFDDDDAAHITDTMSSMRQVLEENMDQIGADDITAEELQQKVGNEITSAMSGGEGTPLDPLIKDMINEGNIITRTDWADGGPVMWVTEEYTNGPEGMQEHIAKRVYLYWQIERSEFSKTDSLTIRLDDGTYVKEYRP